MSEEPLQPQSLGDRNASPDQAKPTSSKTLWIIAVFGLVVGLGLVGWLSSQRQLNVPDEKVSPIQTPVPTPTKDPALQNAAEVALENLLSVLGPLHARDPELWGGELWQNLQQNNTQGDEAMADRRWSDAEEAYLLALEHARELESSASAAPDRLYPKAVEAYGKGERERAVRFLKAILQIDPDHKEAKDLLPRAEVADQTYAAYQEARTTFEQGSLDLAFVEINRVNAVDKAFPGAADLTKKIEEQLVAKELEEIVGRAFSALDAGDVATAQIAVEEAVALAPDAPGVQDARAQIEARVLEQKILALKAKAETLKHQEKWKESHVTWLEISALDPDAPWIRDGLAESLRWAVTHEKIMKGLASPTTPQTGQWVREFQDRRDWPKGLAKKAEELEVLREAWMTPVPVVIISDGETEVTIPKKGRWQEVFEKQIQLLPGSYVAKGGRLGYRDVRVEFDVPPGAEQIEVRVICVEGI